MAGQYSRPLSSQALERGAALAAAIDTERVQPRGFTYLGWWAAVLGVLLAGLSAYVLRAGVW